MNDHDLYFSHADPRDRPSFRPLEPEQRRELAERQHQATVRDESERTDGIVETVEYNLQEALAGGWQRDKRGEVQRDRDGRALAVEQHKEPPATIPGEAVNALLGVPTYADPEPTPEFLIAQESRRREREAKLNAISEKFTAILKRKEQQT